MDDSLATDAPLKRGKFARTISKMLYLRAVVRKKKEGNDSSSSSSFRFEDVGRNPVDKTVKEIAAVESLLASFFASISSIKASYAQLQFAQNPYDWEEIQSADHLVISELKSLSELKQCYLKKQYDFLPEKGVISAEIQEQNSALKTYEIMLKKLDILNKRKDLEIEQLSAQLEECNIGNKLMHMKLNESGHLNVLDNVHPTGLNPNHFVTVLRHAVRSIRLFVRMMVNEMNSAGWDLRSAACAISPGTVYWKDDHTSFAFESFVSHIMFSGFNNQCYSLQHHQHNFKDAKARSRHFYEKCNELRSTSVNECLSAQPNSTFARFCQVKYLALIHPDMELSFFGDLTKQKHVMLGGFPETMFFSSFAEMAKRVWLLHCLALSFDPQVSVFQISPRSRFSELYMESVTDEVFLQSEIEPTVSFTVIPGFQIGKTILQSQVYLN